jgi:tetratricopeptide (TPR) repeat protein
MIGTRSFIWRTTSVASVVLFLTVLVIQIACTSARVQNPDFGSEMVKYTKQGRYDEAIQVGLHSIRNQPSDEIIYQEIADVYLIRASKDAEQREQWLSKAVFYIEKSLSLNSKDRDAAGVDLLQHALGFEKIGDLSAVSRCTYYEKARKLLEERISLLEGDQLVLDGKVFQLAPLREENDKRLAEVLASRAKAGCS